MALIASTGAAEAREATQQIDIAERTLPRALAELAREARVSIGTEGSLPDRPIPPIRARLSIAEALARLLAGSGLVARQVGATAWRIERAAALSAPAPPLPRPDPSPAPPPVTVGPPIVVTGSKRSQPLDQVPIALSVIRFADRLHGSASSDTQTVARASEGLALSGLGPGRNRLFLRGVADSAFVGESQATVAVVLDEARLTYSAPDPDLRLVDVDRVEVLKGPQGSLYGTGTLGGIYHIVTRRPVLDETSLTAAAGVESVAHGGFGGSGSAVLNLPLGARAALRVVGYSAQEPGWVDTGSDRDSNLTDLKGARIALAAEPGGGWRVDLGAVAQSLDTRDSQYVYAAHARIRPAQIAEPHDNDLRHVAIRAERTSGPVALVLSSGVTAHVIDDGLDATQGAGGFGLPDPQSFTDQRRYRVWDNEVRAIGSGGAIRWLVGLSYIRAKQHGDQILHGVSGAAMTINDDRRTAIDSAAFTDVTVPLSGKFDLNLGARLFRNIQHDARRLPAGMVERESTRTGVTPSAALSWRPHDGRLVFLRYGSALRQGNVDISPAGEPVFLKGDEFATFEAGWREERQDGGRLELGVWHSWWRDVQSDLLQPDGLIETANAGNAKIFGVEASVALPLGSGWQAEGGVNVTNAMLTRNTLGLHLDDRRLPVVPDYVVRGAVSRTFSLGGGEANLKASLRYTGPARLSFDPVVDRAMGEVLDSTLDAQLATGSWLWAARVDNVVGASADSFAYGNPLRFAFTRQRTPQRPRTVSLSLQRRF